MIDFARARKVKITRRHIRNRKKLISSFFIVTGFAVLFIFFAAIAVFAWFAKDLPNPNKIVRKEGFSTIISDREGKPLYDVYADENRKPISKEDIPETLKNAVVAVEDKTFYTHVGYSTMGIARAFFTIVFKGDLQGGSTLTQQLVKNVLLTSERTLPRKIKEFILAVQIERKYTKDEILTMYLNEAPYGGTAWGVESAAELYFGKPAKELNLTESAILAGLPQLPSIYSPYSDTPDAYIGRTEHVLRRMRDEGYITREEEEAAKAELPHIQFAGRESTFDAPHFVEYVRKQLVEQFGEDMVEGGGLRVTTTLDSDLQLKAEGILEEELEKVQKLKVSNGAIVILDPQTGEILTMVGSKHYDSEEDADFQGKFNVVVQGLRQPGSALKPLVYATAFESGFTPSTLIMDVPTKFPGGGEEEFYEPKNYDEKFRGPVQMRFTLGNSINVPAVKTLALVGLNNFLETAYRMGLDTLEPTQENMSRFGLSVALGGGEVTLLDLSQSYGVFATGGIKHEPVSILEVKDKNGKTLFKYRETKGERILSEEVSFLISHILSDNEARKEVFGSNSWLHIAGNTVAVKTGTTDDKRDNWTVGFTKETVVGVWVGNNDNSPMDPSLASGVTGAAPIWNRVMRETISSGRSDGIIDVPKNVVALQIDAYGGGLPRDGQPIRSEYFIKGTEPTDTAPIYQRLKVSKNDRGRRATSEEIEKGEYEEKDVMYFEEDDPLSSEKNYWQEGIDTWVRSLNNESYVASGGVSGVDEENPTPTPEEEEEPTKTPILTPNSTL